MKALDQLNMENEIKCPKCGSTQISAQKKGFSAGKAVAGVILTGGIGLAAGAIGSGKIDVTCLSCGNTWTPQTYNEQIKGVQEIQRYKDLNKWNKEWRNQYENGNYDLSLEIYKQRNSRKNLDIHRIYQWTVEKERSEKVTGIVLLVVIGVIVLVALIVAR